MGKIRWERCEFEAYFRILFDRLSLRDWSLHVDDTGPSNPDAAAAIHCTEGRKMAWIDLSDSFLREDEPKQRHYAVHEALHCHGAHEGYLLGQMLSDEQFRAYTLAHEYGVDAIAEAIAPLMPLPSEVLDARSDATPGIPSP